MQENPNIEWKESWNDKYLQWVCAFANTQGGTLYIGKDDNGVNVGVENAKELLEKISTKIRDMMGIIADVNLERLAEQEIIIIKVAEYPFPVSYKGKYYYRSGSTTHELTGAALDSFMLRKQGKTWDSVPVPFESIETLDKSSIKTFRKKALQSVRLSEDDLAVTDKLLLDKLHLYEGEYLKKAAILLFHENPEKWVQGAYIKVGYFGKSDSDLLYQDEIHGPLIEQVDKTLELVYQKYLKALIIYEGIQRVEKYMFPKVAFREILLNAVTHKDYSSGIPIQISVYADKMYVWNPGQLPNSLTIDMLYSKHQSIPFNPKIAETFFKTGMIESWGRGFDKISVACKESKVPLPKFSQDSSGLMVKCIEGPAYKTLRFALLNGDISSGVDHEKKSADDVNDNANLLKDNFSKKQLDRIQTVIDLMRNNPEITTEEIAEATNVSKRTVTTDLEKLRAIGSIKREGSNKSGYWIVSNPFQL